MKDYVTCTFPDGFSVPLRHVCVSTIALNAKQEVLLVKRAPQAHRGGFWTVPGGYLDRDENTEQAVLRELNEESGYRGEIDLLFQITVKPHRIHEDRQNIDFIYIIRVTEGEPQLNREVTEITWFAVQDLPSEEEFAFDHKKVIEKYFAFLKNPFPLPLIVK